MSQQQKSAEQTKEDDPKLHQFSKQSHSSSVVTSFFPSPNPPLQQNLTEKPSSSYNNRADLQKKARALESQSSQNVNKEQ